MTEAWTPPTPRASTDIRWPGGACPRAKADALGVGSGGAAGGA